MALLTSDRDQLDPSFLWLHGFTQTGASAPQFLSILAGTRQIDTPDLPGHGRNALQRWSLSETARVLVANAPAIFDAGGYSLGGRVALHVALTAPERVRRLVLVSSSLGIANTAERDERRRRDEELATRLRLVGASTFLNEWLAQPIFSTLKTTDVEHRSLDAEGLASSLEHSGVGTQEYLGPRVAALTMPVLLVCGERDRKFVAAADEMASLCPTASVVRVPDAGHALPLERPEELAAIIDEFLSA
jgi:2-succinyl-6-hydroxy-2,4-cyclohexadiene-1-carboxylate synthase